MKEKIVGLFHCSSYPLFTTTTCTKNTMATTVNMAKQMSSNRFENIRRQPCSLINVILIEGGNSIQFCNGFPRTLFP